MGNKYGEAIPVLNQRLVPIYKVARDDKLISITLDGTWGANYTEEILQILRENNVKITFFFAGYWLEKYPELVRKLLPKAMKSAIIPIHTLTLTNCQRKRLRKNWNQLPI